MASQYAKLKAQIERLQQKADKVRKDEAHAVIARIREAVEYYQLTPADIFEPTSTQPAAKKTRKPRAPKVKYGDGAGNTWGGRGPRPAWLREALEAGRTLDEFKL